MMSVTLCALTAPLDCLLFVIIYLLPLFSLTISDDMYYHLLTLGSAIAASALPQHATPGCREVNITVTVTAPRFILNTTVNDNWDAAALTLNLTSRDVGSPGDPIPIAGTTAPVTSTYTIGATLCGTGGTMLILTHGIIESKLCVMEPLPRYGVLYSHL